MLETGLLFPGLDIFVDLGMGTIMVVFHCVGSWPHCSEYFKKSVIEGMKFLAVLLSIRGEILSGPFALPNCKADNNQTTSSTEH